MRVVCSQEIAQIMAFKKYEIVYKILIASKASEFTISCLQTETSTVIVEEDLLPRLLAVLPKAPSVKNVVVIPRYL